MNDDNEQGQDLNLSLCPKCDRRFLTERIAVHIKICTKEKKRKVFDTTKMRTQGTEAESFIRKKAPEPKVITKQLY